MNMDDMYVGDYCPTKIHCRGFVFTISELLDIAICKLSHDELVAHFDKRESACEEQTHESLDIRFQVGVHVVINTSGGL